MRVILLLAALVAAVTSHTLHTGRQCPDIDPFPNLSMSKVLGIWYVLYQFDTSNTCLIWNITKVGEESYAVTESRQLHILDALSIDHKHDITGTLDVPNPEVPAKMRIRWPTSLTGKADFIIFDTDYTEYMAVWECDRAGLLHRRSVTILSRTGPVIDQMFVDRIRRKLDSKSVPHGALNIIDHNSCRKQSRFNWHTDGELFGLLSPDASKTENLRVGADVENYDVSELEILSDGVEQHRANIKKP